MPANGGSFTTRRTSPSPSPPRPGELMQHFVWQQEEQIEERVRKNRDEIASEIADVAILLFEFADNLGFKLGDVMAAKIAHNEERYPVAKSRGNNLKYSEL